MRPRFYCGIMARTKARRFACCALALLGAVAVSVCIAVLVRRKCPSDAFSRAAVAADTATCSQIGRDILQAGGSAVDSAIAALLCTSVLNPQSMGLGGGSFFTVMDRSGHVRVINARETTPRKFKPDLLDSCPRTFQMLPGSEWIAVPGEIRGYEEAHRLYGRLPWATLFQPTIRLSRDGFPIPEVLGRYVSTLNSTGRTPLRNLFSDKDGNLLKSGDVVRFHKLADTLETIARHGADAFYQGGIAEDLIRDVQEAGGTITAEDLAAYRVTVTDAWSVDLDDFRLYFPPPPAGGVVLSVVMNIMKGFRLNGEQKTLTYHRYAEALKFANGIKNHIRDPKFSSDKMAKRFTEESFAEHIRSLIRSNVTHDAQYYNITPYVDGVGTTHVSVLAEDGSAVSVTSSINHIFGSTVFSPRTGIILNNQLADFCGGVDRMFPGEQPPSSMSPIVLKSPLRTLVIGSTGATMITTSIASALMNHLWFQKSLKESIGAPVMFVDSRAELTFEPTFDKDLIEALKTVGHKQGRPRRFYNVANAVETAGGCVHAVSDTRKLGEPAGY